MIAATFLDVFPDAFLLRGDLLASHPIVALVGGAGPAPDAAHGRPPARSGCAPPASPTAG